MEKEVLDLFKVMVISEDQKCESFNFDLVAHGVVLDFDPSHSQYNILYDYNPDLRLQTLFSKPERENATIEELITKQILHYVEVYGLNSPGLFNLEFDGGTVQTFKYIRGVTEVELTEMVQKLMYSNAPVKDTNVLKEIIKFYLIPFEFSKIKNNELRMLLFDVNRDTFDNGDDAVRFLCYTATGEPLLIKSEQVITAVNLNSSRFPSSFFQRHSRVLANVFNRHKKLILSAKNRKNRTAINQITRLSKKHHVPIHESIQKTFIHKALNGQISDLHTVLSKISVRDKFKYLNLLSFKKEQMKFDAFVIRNGKIHLEDDRKVYDLDAINRVETAVLNSLSGDLDHLQSKTILLDENVDYGLPVSRKQVVGNIPFGTEVNIPVTGKISAGIYWEDSWGARDLDLSTVDINGNRTGWGMYSGYDDSTGVTFSGDVTSAPSGGMEFMTSGPKSNYGLFVNIYSGDVGAETEIVIGPEGKNKWISDVLFREKVKLNSRGMILGFVKGNKYIAYLGRLNDRAANFGEKNPLIQKVLADPWTVRKLFDELGIIYHFSVDKETKVDYSLKYENFSYDKLEELLLPV